MNIPESVKNITQETQADPFLSAVKLPDLPLDEIVAVFKRSLTTSELVDFQNGLAYYKKDVTSEKIIIKNLFYLLSETLTKAINNSDIDIDTKPVLVVQTKTILESLGNNFDAFYNTLIILNKNKNMLDVKGFLFIIVGYAISLLKKTYNSRNQ